MSKQAKARERTLAAIKKHRNDPGKIAFELGVTYDDAQLVLREYFNGRHVKAVGSNANYGSRSIACEVCGMKFWASSKTDRRRGRIDETGCPCCRSKKAAELRARLRRHFKRGTASHIIAEEFNVSRNQVRAARQRYNQYGIVRALGLRKPGNIPTCATCECGKEKSPGSQQCNECALETRRARNAVNTSPKRLAIIALARSLGHIPTSTEAAEHLGSSRDTANRHIRSVFGADKRKGFHTRNPRPLPDWI